VVCASDSVSEHQ